MEAIDIFFGVDCFEDCVGINMFWEGLLDDEAIYIGVIVEEVDGFKEFLLGDSLI